MGVPYLPVRSMLGTDTGKYSGAKEINCPYTGVKLLALPALYPDVAAIHVHNRSRECPLAHSVCVHGSPT